MWRSNSCKVLLPHGFPRITDYHVEKPSCGQRTCLPHCNVSPYSRSAGCCPALTLVRQKRNRSAKRGELRFSFVRHNPEGRSPFVRQPSSRPPLPPPFTASIPRAGFLQLPFTTTFSLKGLKKVRL
ncbi:unnamed protein product [Victoria cruziana]